MPFNRTSAQAKATGPTLSDLDVAALTGAADLARFAERWRARAAGVVR